MYWSYQTSSSNNRRENSTHGLVNAEIRWIIFFAAKDGEALQSAKTRPGVDCGSDHELLIAKFRLKLKKVGKTTRPFRYDLNQITYFYTVKVTNRPNGLYLIDRVPEELCTQVPDIVKEVVIKTIPKKKKCKKGKWFLRRHCKWLRKEEKLKAKEKRKDVPI